MGHGTGLDIVVAGTGPRRQVEGYDSTDVQLAYVASRNQAVNRGK